jgi:hypothetical protein
VNRQRAGWLFSSKAPLVEQIRAVQFRTGQLHPGEKLYRFPKPSGGGVLGDEPKQWPHTHHLAAWSGEDNISHNKFFGASGEASNQFRRRARCRDPDAGNECRQAQC